MDGLMDRRTNERTDGSMLKVSVNNFSHFWTTPRDRQKERERVRERERERERNKNGGRLNLLPRSNPHQNLHKVKQFLFCQQPITISVCINMAHFITNIQKHPTKNTVNVAH